MDKKSKFKLLEDIKNILTKNKLIVFIITFLAVIPMLYHLDWSGIGGDKEPDKRPDNQAEIKKWEKELGDAGKVEKIEFQDGKPVKIIRNIQPYKDLWDWLNLASTLAVPVAIFLAQANLQTKSEEQNQKQIQADKEIAEDNLKETALQAYLDRIGEILINEELRLKLLPNKDPKHPDEDNVVREFMSIKTVTILRRLEGDRVRQRHVLDFLRDSKLLHILSKANLYQIDISGANLYKADLSGANLNKANLSGAFLLEVNLSGTSLIQANLSGANLSLTNLYEADLSGANLNKAYLQQASLMLARLSGADLSEADLSGADVSYTDFTNVINFTPQQRETVRYDWLNTDEAKDLDGRIYEGVDLDI